MSTTPARSVRHGPRAARGFTLVELMVTVAIALFLLYGLVTIVQNVRTADTNQRALAQLQDQERFALTVITDVVQAGGYFPDAVVWQPANSLLPQTDATGSWEAGQALNGIHAVAAPGDTLAVRLRTGLNSGGQNDGVILCDGSINTAQLPNHAFTNTFTVQNGNANPALNGLYCSVDNVGSAAPPGAQIAPGVVNMKVYYGVKRDFAFTDYNVDTYLTADQMCSPLVNPCGSDDWSNVSSVRVILTFINPLAAKPGQPAIPGQPPTIQFERVIEVMARGGVHT
jgi:type IV pilus assembly protein PilW